MKKIEEASHGIAEVVKMCRPQVIPLYPITPQTHIVEKLTEYINDGELDAKAIDVESEHSALSAAIGASATGSRVFTATSSQGLALMNEILFVAAGMRMPIVMAVANRALSAPINIWNDHQDSISARDSGWLQFYVESAQEAIDTVIQAYKIAEDKNVLLPIMVCLDGFTLSHVYENVDMPEQKEIDKFLPKYVPFFKLDSKKPVTMGPVGGPDYYMQIKKMQQDSIMNSFDIIKKVHNDFKKQFGRNYGNGFIEEYKTNDAEKVLVCMGTICGTARVVVDELRSKGEKVGLIKLKCFRPFPREILKKVLNHIKEIAILDRDISAGNYGVLFTEVRDSLYGTDCKIKNYIVGLGGKDVTKKDLLFAFENINNGEIEWLI